MELYYTTNIFETSAILGEEESYHCIKILRHKTSDVIHFTDGQGRFYKGRIVKADTKKCEIEIIEKEERAKKDYYLHIAIAPTKNIDRMEFFLEKAVEIGINEISFLKCERSERKEIKVERLQKIAVSAMKQSKKAFLPLIHSITPYKEFIKKEIPNAAKFIANIGNDQFKGLKDIDSPMRSYLILIGPEGDFSPSEVKAAKESGFQSLSLGENILRTETAGVFVCAFFNIVNQLGHK